MKSANNANQPKSGKKAKRSPGRPTLYRAEFAEQAVKLGRLGLTDKEISQFFEVDEATLNRWKKAHPEFRESLKRGKAPADAEVADRLFKRATGYSHPDTKVLQYEGAPVIVPIVKHYAPDTLACIYWLKNRRPDLWRDKVNLEHSGPDGGPIRTEGEFRPSEEDEAVIKRIAEMRNNIPLPKPE